MQENKRPPTSGSAASFVQSDPPGRLRASTDANYETLFETSCSDPLATLQSERKFRHLIFEQLKQYPAFSRLRFSLQKRPVETDVLGGDEVLDCSCHLQIPHRLKGHPASGAPIKYLPSSFQDAFEKPGIFLSDISGRRLTGRRLSRNSGNYELGNLQVPGRTDRRRLRVRPISGPLSRRSRRHFGRQENVEFRAALGPGRC